LLLVLLIGAFKKPVIQTPPRFPGRREKEPASNKEGPGIESLRDGEWPWGEGQFWSKEILKEGSYQTLSTLIPDSDSHGFFIIDINSTDWAVSVSLSYRCSVPRVSLPGSGPIPQQGDLVTFHYTGTLSADGKIFDSSRGRGAVSMNVGMEPPKLVPGVDQALRRMRTGERAVVKIAPV
jgi:hypothetical protein